MIADFCQSFQEFEQHVAQLFRRGGWEVTTPPANQPFYDLIVRKGSHVGAVQVKWLQNQVATPQLIKFADFIGSRPQEFTCGFFITTKGFGSPALALIRSWGPQARIFCGIAREQDFEWLRTQTIAAAAAQGDHQQKRYLGVFTCKGGVGKTTVAAHLAGAFLLQQLDVALVDLDPEQNLLRLLGDGVYVPGGPGQPGYSLEVFRGEDWHEDAARSARVVVCDCSPALERNPRNLIERLDYCLIPTTLNPLGLNKHGKVIRDTVREIRAINSQAHLFVLANQFRRIAQDSRLELLRSTFLQTYEDLKDSDPHFHCIDPLELCIRSSDQLYYWGLHILEDPKQPRSQLAFNLVGGRSHPREDFLQLADYLEQATEIHALRSPSPQT